MDPQTLASIQLPRHIGIIMDGNGRWAQRRGLPRSEGHKAGAAVFRRICDYASEIGLEAVTFYAFSTENWKRPQNEIDAIMELFRDYLFRAEQSQEENEQKGIQLRFIGELDALPGDIMKLMKRFEQLSRDKHRTVINLAVNYGGRAEIVDAVKSIAQQVEQGVLRSQDITEQLIGDNLYTHALPDPDIIIRPSGEYRLSNFMIWQSAYSEFWYSDVLWPDFTTEDLDRAILDYCRRNRRFGGV